MGKQRKGLQRTDRPRWLFVVRSRIGYAVRTTPGYWKLITTVKHPSLAGREHSVIRTLTVPDQVRVSKADTSVYMFYRKINSKHLCVVTKKLTPSTGFIMTAYFTEKMKEGRIVWKR